LTMSSGDRRAYINQALAEFLNSLGDGMLCHFRIEPKDYPAVLKTTWLELTSRGWLHDMDMNPEMYELSAAGYVEALHLSGRCKKPEFLEALGRICMVLKGRMKDRADSQLIDFYTLVREANVSEGFAFNAIEADLIRCVIGKVGARWDGELLIEVPPDFGLRLL
jgi:hypothetical protein